MTKTFFQKKIIFILYITLFEYMSEKYGETTDTFSDIF